jgi:DNA replication protein DnaC
MGLSIGMVAAGLLVAGASVYSGERQRSIQKKQMRNQKLANERQIAQAVSAQKLAAQADAKANQREPNTMALMEKASLASRQGPASTMLTGAGGIGKGSLLLGKSTLLGGSA